MSDTNDGKATNKPASFSDVELAAMKARTQELKTEAKESKNRAAGETAVLTAIAALDEPDRTLASRIHQIVTENSPTLMPKTWYGMPAYADKDGKVICFFQASTKFKTRYSTFGFQPDAHLDAGAMWPVAFAVTALTEAEEAQIVELLKRAVS